MSFYFVCDRCNCKWFAACRVHRCPRCDKRCESREQRTAPWLPTAKRQSQYGLMPIDLN
jgi:hypothetical protein